MDQSSKLVALISFPINTSSGWGWSLSSTPSSSPSSTSSQLMRTPENIFQVLLLPLSSCAFSLVAPPGLRSLCQQFLSPADINAYHHMSASSSFLSDLTLVRLESLTLSSTLPSLSSRSSTGGYSSWSSSLVSEVGFTLFSRHRSLSPPFSQLPLLSSPLWYLLFPCSIIHI